MDLYKQFNTLNTTKINSIAMYVFDMNLTEIYQNRDRYLSEDEIYNIKLGIDAYLKNIPLARIFNKRIFCGSRFYVSPFVLDPRPETEAIVEYIIKNKTFNSVLDIGVGSGAILLSLLKHNQHARGVGIDISPHALANAKHNANALSIVNVELYLSMNDVKSKFDLIISNPPYIVGEVEYEAKFDPPISLYDNDLYAEIIAKNYLNENGSIILEVPKYSINHIKKLASINFNNINTFEIGNNIFLLELQY